MRVRPPQPSAACAVCLGLNPCTAWVVLCAKVMCVGRLHGATCSKGVFLGQIVHTHKMPDRQIDSSGTGSVDCRSRDGDGLCGQPDDADTGGIEWFAERGWMVA